MARLSRAESAQIVGELRSEYGSNAGIVRGVFGLSDPRSRDYKAALRQVERYTKGERAIGGAYREAILRAEPERSPVRARLEGARPKSRGTVQTAPGRPSPKSAVPPRVAALKRRVRAGPNGTFELRAPVSFGHNTRGGGRQTMTRGAESQQLLEMRRALQEVVGGDGLVTMNYSGEVNISDDEDDRDLRDTEAAMEDEAYWMDDVAGDYMEQAVGGGFAGEGHMTMIFDPS